MTISLKPHQLVANKKAASLLKNIPENWRLERIPSVEEESNASKFADTILSSGELNIINKSARELLRLQEEGKLTALEITNAYCHRAAIIHQLTQCCTEIFFDKALVTAGELDEYFKINGKLKGKLHGIPVSLKDQINLPGIDTGIGYIGPYISEEIQKQITHRKSLNDESLLATILRNEGAVFYVKSTVPMAMLAGETSSNLGTTRNALDRRMAPGGSSGGEGALLGGKASIIGIGTDIGGSIRIPSVVHGLYGLRACSNRFPYLDIANSYPNQICVCSVVGPMCRFPEDVALISEAIINNPLCSKDPKWIPIPWRNELYRETLSKDLKIGILKWDGNIMPQAPISKRFNELKELFESNGYESKYLELSGVSSNDLMGLLLELYTCDNFEEIKKFCDLSGEPMSDLLKRSFKLPEHVDSVSEFFDKAGRKYELQQQMDKWWDEVYPGMDCIVLPAYAAPNWFIGEANKISSGYTRSVNVLDYTAITVPIDYVNEEDDSWERNDFVSDHDREVWDYYNKEEMIGKPISLQILCRRYQEEKIIALTERISQLFQYHKK